MEAKGAGNHLKLSREWLAVLAIALVGLALRLYHIGNHGFFVDEVYSVLVARGTGDPELIQFDAARPLYFVLLKGWLTFASSETWMRLLSVIFGTANIILIYLLGRLAGGTKVGLAAAVLAALSPMEVHYSQQARMYTMGSFFALAGSIAFVKSFETEKRQFVFLWALARLLMVLTLPLTGMLLMIDCVCAFTERKKTKLLPVMALCGLALLLAWSPFILILLQARTSQYDSWRASLDIPDLIDFFTLLVNFTASAVPLQESGGPPCFDCFSTAYVVIFAPVLGLAIAFCHKQAKIIFCLAWGFVPLSALFAWSNISDPLLITRYTLFTAPFIFIVLAFGWAQAWTRWRPIGFGIAAVYLLAMSSCLIYFYSHAVHEDWRPVCEYIAGHEKPGDQIVVWNYHSKHLIGYYYRGHNNISDMKVITPDDANENDDQAIQKVNLQLEIAPKPGQRLWLVSRVAAPGWTHMHEVYGLYQVALAKRFKVLHHENLAMTDLYEVIVP